MTSGDLIYRRNQYEQLRNDIEQICQYLENTSSRISTVASEIQQCYIVDGAGADNQRVSKIKNNVDTILKNLRGTIVPQIGQQIGSLNYSIRVAQERERKEREENERV